MSNYWKAFNTQTGYVSMNHQRVKMQLPKLNSALILAAGKNTRFDTGIPKSLHHLNDTTLLERHIRAFHCNRIYHVAVVIGYRGDIIAEYINQLNRSLIYPVTIIENTEFERANGLSIFVAASWINSLDTDYFACTMSDHVYHPSFYSHTIKQFQSYPISKAISQEIPLHLVIDKPGVHNTYIDFDDVTRVLVDDTHKCPLIIRQVGKLQTEYNYFDTGMFLLHKNIFTHLDEITRLGKDSISDLVNTLASRGLAHGLDLTGFYWNDIDTPEDFKIAQSQSHLIL